MHSGACAICAAAFRQKERNIVHGRTEGSFGKAEAEEKMVRTFLEKLPDPNKAAELLGLDLKEVRRIASKFGLLP